MDINLICPINQLGYGIASLNILKALMLNRHKICLFVIQQGEANIHDIPLVEQAQTNAKSYNSKAPSVRIWHAQDLAMQVGKGLHCGFPIFELNQFRPEEVHQLKNQDVVFVASKWAEDIVRQHGIARTCVVPLGVDRSIFHYNLPKENTSTTVFINCGKWEKRKGHDILVTAFNKAFNRDDNVKLIMHCYNTFLSPPLNKGKDGNRDWQFMYEKSKLGKEGKIIVSPRLPSQHDVARAMMKADCGVFPSRGEGWNLELLECLSLGKHVITTNYSAHTEYVNSDNAHLISMENVELADDGIWFHKEGYWGNFANDQMEQLIYHLRNVHKLKQEGSLLLNQQGVATAEKFSWQNTAKRLIEGLEAC